jgi:hypothetical protein
MFGEGAMGHAEGKGSGLRSVGASVGFRRANKSRATVAEGLVLAYGR